MRGVLDRGVEGERRARVAARRRRVVKKQVVVTTQQQRVVKANASSESQSARQSVVDLELSSRMQVHRAESAAQRRVGSQSHARGTGSGARFQVAEEDSTDDEAGEDEREVGTAEWRSQQERRRARYRTTVTSTALYDVETIRREREAKEALEVERTKLEKEKRQVKEQAWAEASERVEEEASRGGGFLSGRMRRFTEEIERGWTKDYAGKSTGLTAKKWDDV